MTKKIEIHVFDDEGEFRFKMSLGLKSGIAGSEEFTRAEVQRIVYGQDPGGSYYVSYNFEGNPTGYLVVRK